MMFAAVAAGCAVLLVGSGASAEGCRSLSGRFTLDPITGSECTSPVGLCAAGTFTGALKGTSVFVASSLVPTVDTPATGTVLVTGDAVLTVKGGTILTKDAVVLRTVGAGEFAEVDTIVGGTGDFAGATGAFQSTGTFTQAGGQASYTVALCQP